MTNTLSTLAHYARFPFARRGYLKDALTVDSARQIIHHRLEQRDETFLRIAERAIYQYPRSPYRPLLEMAGCQLDDLRALVKQKGLEAALRHLCAAGVYVSFEEFKGRKPIVRGGCTLTDYTFQNPGMELDPEEVPALADAYLAVNAWDVNGGMDAASIRYTLDFYLNGASLETALTPDQVSNLSFLDAVLDEIGRQ